MTIDPMVTSALITSAAGLAGSGGGFSHAANKMNRRSQDRAFRYNRALRQTAVTDRMADLDRAGINPILAGKYNADSPGVGVGSSFDPSIGRAARVNAISGAMSTAYGGAKLDNEVELIHQEVGKTIAEYNSIREDAIRKRKYIEDYMDNLLELDVEKANLTVEALTEQLKVAQRMGEVAETDFGLWMKYLGEFTGAIGNIFGGSATYRVNP